MKRFLACGLFLSLAAPLLAGMTAQTSWTQRWPWETRVDVDVALAGGAKCDLAVTASFRTNGVPVTLDLEQAGLEGDIWELTPGYHHLVWDPAKAGFDVQALTDFSVTVTPVEDATAQRAWLVFDVATGRYDYLSEEAAPAGGWGQDRAYATEKIVFRRIPAGTFTLGYTPEQIARLKALSSPRNPSLLKAREVTLTSDYYISIYQITGGQINRVDPRASSAESTSGWCGDKRLGIGCGRHCFLRGSNAVEGVCWPDTKFRVTPDSWIGRFRARSGGRLMFDLPTCAQWQRAARPDAQWIWYDTPQHGGGTVADDAETLTNVVGAISHTIVELENHPDGNWWNPPGRSGQYQPNAFGLCDLVGSRLETVLDQSAGAADSTEARDPVGSSSSPTSRMCLNSFVNTQSLGGWSLAAFGSAPGDGDLNSDTMNNFRLVIHLRPPESFGGMWE